MVTRQGVVLGHTVVPNAAGLREDAPAGSTILLIDDTTGFDANGGPATISQTNDVDDDVSVEVSEELTYGAADLELDALQLTAPTVNAYAAGADVIGVGSTLIVQVDLGGEEEPLPCELTHMLKTAAVFADEEQDYAGVQVVVEEQAGRWFIVNVIGQDGRLNGGAVDPNLPVPIPGPTEPPSEAPVVMMSPFAVGAVRPKWEAVEGAQWYDVYASLTPGFDADDPANLVVSGVTGLETMVAAVAGVQIPVDGTPVYVKVKAVNVIGAGPVSNEASAAARQADAEFISALMAMFGTVEGQEAIFGTLKVLMRLEAGGGFSVGDRITIMDPDAPDDQGGIIIWGDDAHTIVKARFHPDGNYLDGILVAQDITVIKALRLIGDASAIASGAKVKLENGVANPAAPTVGSTVDSTLSYPLAAGTYTERGLAWDHDAGKWWQLLWNSGNERAYIRSITPAGVTSSVILVQAVNSAIGGEYSYDEKLANGLHYAEGLLWTHMRVTGGVVGAAAWVPGALSKANGTWQRMEDMEAYWWIDDVSPAAVYPALWRGDDEIDEQIGPGFDPIDSTYIQLTRRFIGQTDYVEQYARINRTALPDLPRMRSLRVGTFDYGGPTYLQIATHTGNVYHFVMPASWANGNQTPTTLVRAPERDFVLDGGGTGFDWNQTDGSFYSTRTNGKVARYSNYYPAVGELGYARSVDTGAGGIHTAAGALSPGVAIPARRFPLVTLNPPPQGVTGAEVYFALGTVAPTLLYKRTEPIVERVQALLGGARLATGEKLKTVNVTSKTLAANVATLTSNNHELVVGQSVLVAGVDVTFDGNAVISAVTANTFSYARNGANVAATATAGTATVQGANTMGGSPAELYDDFGNYWRGNGVIDFPGLLQAKAIVAPAEDITAYANHTHTLTLTRIGRVVFCIGTIARTAGTSTGFVNAVAIPVGWRPNKAMTLPGSTMTLGSSVWYQHQLDLAGHLLLRMSELNANQTYIATHWITDDAYPA